MSGRFLLAFDLLCFYGYAKHSFTLYFKAIKPLDIPHSLSNYDCLLFS